MDIGFTGVFNEASRQYPMLIMKIKQFTCRVYCCGLMSEVVNEGLPEMMDFEWVYHDGW